LRGLNGSTTNSIICDIEAVVNSNKITFPTLVSNSSLLSSEEILLGTDNIGKGKKFGIYMPVDDNPMLFTNENSANSWQTQNRKYQIPELPIQEISLIRENSPEYELTLPNLNLNQKVNSLNTIGVRETSPRAGNPFQSEAFVSDLGDSIAIEPVGSLP
jgi:hypothetical protein